MPTRSPRNSEFRKMNMYDLFLFVLEYVINVMLKNFKYKSVFLFVLEYVIYVMPNKFKYICLNFAENYNFD